MNFPIEFVNVKNQEDYKNIAINVGGNALVVTIGAVALSLIAKLVLMGGSIVTFIAMPLIVGAAVVYGGTLLADKLFGSTERTNTSSKPMPPAKAMDPDGSKKT
jgi:hypothetical protein